MRFIVLILFISTLLSSCAEFVEVDLKSDDKLVLECYMTVGQEITATLSTAANFNDINDIAYPTNARIYLLNNAIDAPFEFIYDPERKLYYIPQNVHTPNPTWSYEIRAYLRDNPDYEVKGVTKFRSISSSPTKSAQLLHNDLMQVPLDFGEQTEGFLRVLPYVYTYDVIAGDTILSEPILCEFVEGMSDYTAYYESATCRGILIDLSRVNTELLGINVALPEGNIYPAVIMHVQSISEDTYRYDISKSRQIDAIQSSSSDPVISYSNIVDGHGVFGSQYPITLTIPVR